MKFVALLVGVVIYLWCAIAFGGVAQLKNFVPLLLGILLALGFVGSLKKGIMPGRFPHSVRREEQPVLYWITASGFILAAGFMIAVPVLRWIR